MRFDKENHKKGRKKLEPVEEDTEESIESKIDEEVVEAPSEAPVEASVEPLKPKAAVYGEAKSTEVYGTEKGEATLQYEKSSKKGFCELRERTKAVYGIKYAAGKAVDVAKKAKAAIMDWCFILPKKSDPERKKREDLL